MSQQGLRQASVRTVTGTSFDYNGDFSALFDLNAIPAGDWNGRFLTWLNIFLGVSYTSLPGAMAAFAAAEGATNWSSVGTFDASGMLAEFDALIADMSPAPNAARQYQINRLIHRLGAGGVWAKTDLLYVAAAHDQQGALLNWKNPGTNDLTIAGTVSFLADRGLTGNGVDGQLTPGINWNALTLYLQNSAFLGFWSGTDENASDRDIGAVASTSVFLTGRSSGTLGARTGQGATTSVAIGDSLGFYGANRTGAALIDLHKNGAVVFSGVNASSALPATGVVFMQGNGANFSTRQMRAGLIGGALTTTEIAAVNAGLLSYMQAVGAG